MGNKEFFLRVSALGEEKNINELGKIKEYIDERISSLVKEKIFLIVNKKPEDVPELQKELDKLEGYLSRVEETIDSI